MILIEEQCVGVRRERRELEDLARHCTARVCVYRVSCFFLMDFRLKRRSVQASFLARGATNAQLSRLQKQNFLQKEPRQKKKELNF